MLESFIVHVNVRSGYAIVKYHGSVRIISIHIRVELGVRTSCVELSKFCDPNLKICQF